MDYDLYCSKGGQLIPIAKPLIGKEEEKAVIEVLRSGQITSGKWTEEFEQRFAEYIGSKHCVATGNGTEALYLALQASGVSLGDEVITTPFTFIASANAILFVGAIPVFVDIDEETFNIDPELIEKAVTKKTKAILPVHLYGLPSNMPEIMRIAKKHNLTVIEDAAQAHGASILGQKVGTFGKAASFSFYPTKNMTTSEGGAVTTNDDNVSDMAHLLREQGMRIRYHHEVVGYNFRMTNIQAAIGLEQLKKLEAFTSKRIKNAAYLTKNLLGIKGLITPVTPSGYRHVFHQYTIRITKDYSLSRDQLIDKLKEAEIGAMIYYPIPVHKQRPYLNLGYNDKLPITDKVSSEVLSIPVHPSLTKDNLDKIVRTLKS